MRKNSPQVPSPDFRGKEEYAWIAVGSIEQIALGQGRCFLIGARQIAIFRLRSGEVYALDAVCPHRGGPLAEGLVGRDTDFTVRSYPVEMRDGNLFVGLPPRDQS